MPHSPQNPERRAFIAKGCACSALFLAGASPVAAEPKAPEDWRLSFVKKRYGRLLEILSSRMDEKALKETLFDLGTYCSGLGDGTTKKFRGDLEGFRQMTKRGVSGDDITFDWEKGVITMASGERTDCFCPLISRLHQKSATACNCSLGWQKHTWETLLQKQVQVELKESVLRGDKRCVFEIRVLGPLPNQAAAS
jgi:hypothetical protein